MVGVWGGGDWGRGALACPTGIVFGLTGGSRLDLVAVAVLVLAVAGSAERPSMGD